MTSDYEQLTLDYLAKARGHTGDPTDRQLNATIANAYATRTPRPAPRGLSEKARREGRGFCEAQT